MMVLSARGLSLAEEEELLLSFPRSACPRPDRGWESRPRILNARTLRQAQGRHWIPRTFHAGNNLFSNCSLTHYGILSHYPRKQRRPFASEASARPAAFPRSRPDG